MWNQYPPPSYAAYAWFQGDQLMLALPGETSGHKVHALVDLRVLRDMAQTSPFAEQRLSLEERKTLAGLYSLLTTLKARESADHKTIGTPAAPTQYDLDLILKALGQGKVTKIEPKKKVTETFTIDDLDLGGTYDEQPQQHGRAAKGGKWLLPAERA